MRVQNFKPNDETELKMQAIGDPAFNLTSAALDEFYAGCYDCSPFLLMLYDEKRMPFSNRIPRAAFVDFVKEALIQFPVTGTFESYIFVLLSVFGSTTDIGFTIPDPGKLHIDVMAIAETESVFLGREFLGGTSYEFFEMTDDDGNILIFRGVPGISTEYELNLLFAELIPTGISPTITLGFFTRYAWVAEEPGPEFYNMVDYFDNQIVFYEV
jgi:hypothetical protein